MSRWKKLLGPCAASRAGEPTWPVEIEDVTGKLSARVSAAGTAMAFALTWRDQEYVSPVDGRSYIAGGGWGTYQPTTPPGAPAISTVTIKKVQLLTPQSELAARSSAADLAAFCQEVQRCAQRAFGDREVAAELVIRMRCTPEGHDVDLSSRGEVPQPVMQAFYEAVKQLARLPVKDGEVNFEIELTVSPGWPERLT